MKRKIEFEDGALNAKKAKLEMMVPLEGSVSLLQLAVLQKALGSYCISISSGLAIPDSVCDYCCKGITSSNTSTDIDKLFTDYKNIDEEIKYNVYVLAVQLARSGQYSSMSVEKHEEKLIIIFHDLLHLSWYTIQFLLCEGPVYAISCDMTSQKIKVTYKRGISKEAASNNEVLREVMLKYQKMTMQSLSQNNNHGC